MVFISAVAKPNIVALLVGVAIISWISLSATSVKASGGDPARGAEIFADWNCSDCHTLANAGAYGTIGPSLDDNPNLSYDYVVSRITDGGGAMPPFGGQLTEDEIADLAAYIVDAAG